MGTTYNVVAIDSGTGVTESQLRGAIDGALTVVNASMSNWDAFSEISLINTAGATGSVALSPELDEVMQAAAAVNIASAGAFDTTIGPLIELWGFGAPGETAMPSDDAVMDALAASGHGNTLRLGKGQLEKAQPDTQVYLAAIGKGYGADLVGRAIEALGITDYMVEIGGDLYASGHNADGLPWQIGIETPNAFDRGILDVVATSGMGLASSGDYRNYFELDGQRYSHVIDPVTGRPITHTTASTTVLAENGMLADAWATAMLILGRDKGMAIADEQNLAVMFVERDTTADHLSFKVEKSAAFTAVAS